MHPAEDSARYYCKVWSDGVQLISDALRLTVTPQSIRPGYAASSSHAEVSDIVTYNSHGDEAGGQGINVVIG